MKAHSAQSYTCMIQRHIQGHTIDIHTFRRTGIQIGDMHLFRIDLWTVHHQAVAASGISISHPQHIQNFRSNLASVDYPCKPSDLVTYHNKPILNQSSLHHISSISQSIFNRTSKNPSSRHQKLLDRRIRVLVALARRRLAGHTAQVATNHRSVAAKEQLLLFPIFNVVVYLVIEKTEFGYVHCFITAVGLLRVCTVQLEVPPIEAVRHAQNLVGHLFFTQEKSGSGREGRETTPQRWLGWSEACTCVWVPTHQE